MITAKEIARRSIQLFAGQLLFNLPCLMPVRIWLYRRFFEIGERAEIAEKVQFIVPHDYPKQKLIIGDFVEIGPRVTIDYSGGVTIGDHVWISEDVLVFTHDHLIGTAALKKTQGKKSCPLNVEPDSWIGSRSIILPSVERIGRGAIIGAGSVVTKSIDDYFIVAGNPAQVVGRRIQQDQVKKP